jgi:hypothetical protein
LVVFVIMGIVFTLGAYATRWYWLVRSLQGGQDQVVTQMQTAQQRSFAESYPNIYGIRVQPGSSNWAVVKGNASTNTCTVVNSFTLTSGAKFVAPTSPQVDFTADAGLTTPCRNATPNANASDQVAFFYPSGATNAAATTGSTVLLNLATINRTRTITVSQLTGKVTRSP